MVNRKKLYRLYKEEKLTVRKRGGRKRALGTRAPMTIPQGANQRWSVDFASDALVDSRRFRVFCVIDDFTRECLAVVVDNSITGERVSRELDRIAEHRGYPLLVVSDNGTEFTSNAMLVEPVVLVVVAVGSKQAMVAPFFDGVGRDVEHGSSFAYGQQAAGAKALVAGGQAVLPADGLYAPRPEDDAEAGAQSVLVQQGGGLRVGVAVEEGVRSARRRTQGSGTVALREVREPAAAPAWPRRAGARQERSRRLA